MSGWMMMSPNVKVTDGNNEAQNVVDDTMLLMEENTLIGRSNVSFP